MIYFIVGALIGLVFVQFMFLWIDEKWQEWDETR